MVARLTASFGHDTWTGVWISLRSDQFDTERFTDALSGFGCCPTRHAKIIDVIRQSGRYDCCVQMTWINHSYHRLCADMIEAGVTVVTDPTYRPPRLRSR